MSMQPGVQPIFILPENTQRSSGKNAQRNNILAAKIVAETVRTTLGPRGMDKMLVNEAGEVTVTNDGVTILEQMRVAHPAAKMVVEVARTQEDEVGDGTTTAVILAGELLKNAEKLLDDRVHPTVIIKGYRAAETEAQRILEQLGEPVSARDTAMLKRIAQTAMTGKGAEAAKEHLAQLAVKAVRAVAADDPDIDLDSIKIEHAVGGAITESELIDGIVLDKERVHPRMPATVENAKILLLDSPLELRETEVSAKITISDPEQMQGYLDMEERMLAAMVQRITATGANVVLCQKGADDLASYQLAKHGVLVARRVKKSDMEKLAKATGAQIISDLKDARSDVLGKAGAVVQRKTGDEQMLFIEGCKRARAVTLLLRGGTPHVVDEVVRAVTDAVGDLRAALRSGKVVAGAGAVEMELARRLHKYSRSLRGREQLAVEAFAQAMEAIPRTLAENAGLDPIDVLADLKSAHGKSKWAGVDVSSGKVIDAWRAGILEPLRIKTQALSSATDVACMILRIDDVIKSGGEEPSIGDLEQ